MAVFNGVWLKLGSQKWQFVMGFGVKNDRCAASPRHLPSNAERYLLRVLYIFIAGSLYLYIKCREDCSYCGFSIFCFEVFLRIVRIAGFLRFFGVGRFF